VFEGLSSELITKVTHTNAEKLFDWKMADSSLVELMQPQEWVQPVTFAPQGIRHIEPDELQGCGFLVKAGNGLVRCAQPIGDSGLCAAGHSQRVSA
jgi:hypothetical protein